MPKILTGPDELCFLTKSNFSIFPPPILHENFMSAWKLSKWPQTCDASSGNNSVCPNRLPTAQTPLKGAKLLLSRNLKYSCYQSNVTTVICNLCNAVRQWYGNLLLPHPFPNVPLSFRSTVAHSLWTMLAGISLREIPKGLCTSTKATTVTLPNRLPTLWGFRNTAINTSTFQCYTFPTSPSHDSHCAPIGKNAWDTAVSHANSMNFERLSLWDYLDVVSSLPIHDRPVQLMQCT